MCSPASPRAASGARTPTTTTAASACRAAPPAPHVRPASSMLLPLARIYACSPTLTPPQLLAPATSTACAWRRRPRPPQRRPRPRRRLQQPAPPRPRPRRRARSACRWAAASSSRRATRRAPAAQTATTARTRAALMSAATCARTSTTATTACASRRAPRGTKVVACTADPLVTGCRHWAGQLLALLRGDLDDARLAGQHDHVNHSSALRPERCRVLHQRHHHHMHVPGPVRALPSWRRLHHLQERRLFMPPQPLRSHARQNYLNPFTGLCGTTCPANTSPVGAGNFGRVCVAVAATGTTTPAASTTPSSIVACVQSGSVFLIAGTSTTCTCGSQCEKCAYDTSTNAALGCLTCKNANYLNPNGACLSTCPGGYIGQGPGPPLHTHRSLMTGAGNFARVCVAVTGTTTGASTTTSTTTTSTTSLLCAQNSTGAYVVGGTGSACACGSQCYSCKYTPGQLMPGTCTVCKVARPRPARRISSPRRISTICSTAPACCRALPAPRLWSVHAHHHPRTHAGRGWATSRGTARRCAAAMLPATRRLPRRLPALLALCRARPASWSWSHASSPPW